MNKKHLWVVTALIVTLFCSHLSAKNIVAKTYIFGFAASFNDTIVHFTDIQEVDSVWIDSKTKFLQGRDNYSYQLRNYLNNQEHMRQRTCIVISDRDKSKLEKKYLKMRRLYTGEQSSKKSKKKQNPRQFDVRYTTSSEFRFMPVNMNIIEEGEE